MVVQNVILIEIWFDIRYSGNVKDFIVPRAKIVKCNFMYKNKR